MTVTLSYDTTLSRVRVEATGLPTDAPVVVERSTDEITWTTVRGGVSVPVSAGAMSRVDDYEFVPDVPNHYRVTYPAAMSFVNAGTAAHASNASVAPGVPASIAAGDVLLMLAAIRNSGAGAPATPAGWSKLVDAGNMCLFGKIAGGSESSPTVTFTGGVANADTSAQIAAFRGVDLAPLAAATQLNSSGQDIAAPAVNLAEAVDHAMVLHLGWKQDDWTSVAPVADGTEIGEPDTTTGDDQGIVWDYRLITTFAFATVNARTFAVTGGGAAISRAATAVFSTTYLSQSDDITPVLDTVWLKNISRPFLNRPVTVTDWSDVERPSRNGVFDIIGRTMPIAVTDLRSSRRYDLVLTTATVDEADELDLALASGEPVLIHVPADCPMPGMYAVVGDVTISRREPRSVRRYLNLPLIECAAPAPEIVGATNTWAAVIAGYATWADLIAANPTWQDVLDGVADPGDVVVD
jgi:hypothetical protein